MLLSSHLAPKWDRWSHRLKACQLVGSAAALAMREVTFATGEDVLVLENALSKKKDSTTNHKWELSCEGDFVVHNLNQALVFSKHVRCHCSRTFHCIPIA